MYLSVYLHPLPFFGGLEITMSRNNSMPDRSRAHACMQPRDSLVHPCITTGWNWKHGVVTLCDRKLNTMSGVQRNLNATPRQAMLPLPL